MSEIFNRNRDAAAARQETYRMSQDPRFAKHLRTKLKDYGYVNATHAGKDFDAIFGQTAYNLSHNADIDWGDRTYNPHQNDEQTNYLQASYVKKYKKAPSADERRIWGVQEKYKDDYDMSLVQDNDAFQNGDEPYMYKVSAIMRKERDALDAAYQKGGLTEAEARKIAPYTFQLHDSTVAEETARKNKEAEDLANGKTPARDDSMLYGTPVKKKKYLDYKTLAELGWDEKTGFQGVIDAINDKRAGDITKGWKDWAANHAPRPITNDNAMVMLRDGERAINDAIAQDKESRKADREFLLSFAKLDFKKQTGTNSDGTTWTMGSDKKPDEVVVYGLRFSRQILEDPKKVDTFLRFVKTTRINQETDLSKGVRKFFGAKADDVEAIEKAQTTEEKRAIAQKLLDDYEHHTGYAAVEQILNPYTDAGAALLGFENSATAGLYELVNKNDAYNPVAIARELSPTAYGAGEFVGQALPIGGLESAAAKGLKLIAPRLVQAAPILTGMIRGGASMAAYTGIRDVAEGRPAEEVALDMVINGSIGAAFGAAGGKMAKDAAVKKIASELDRAAVEYKALLGGVKGEGLPVGVSPNYKPIPRATIEPKPRTLSGTAIAPSEMGVGTKATIKRIAPDVESPRPLSKTTIQPVAKTIDNINPDKLTELQLDYIDNVEGLPPDQLRYASQIYADQIGEQAAQIQDAINSVEDAIRSYQKKGISLVPTGKGGFYKSSNNDMWYRDFYAKTKRIEGRGRAPRASEIHDLAREIVYNPKYEGVMYPEKITKTIKEYEQLKSLYDGLFDEPIKAINKIPGDGYEVQKGLRGMPVSAGEMRTTSPRALQRATIERNPTIGIRANEAPKATVEAAKPLETRAANPVPVKTEKIKWNIGKDGETATSADGRFISRHEGPGSPRHYLEDSQRINPDGTHLVPADNGKLYFDSPAAAKRKAQEIMRSDGNRYVAESTGVVPENNTLTGTLDGATTSVDGKPVRQFRSNTIERTTKISDDIKKEFGFEDYTYEPEKAAKWQETAEQRIASTDRQTLINDLMGKKVLTAEEQHMAATITPDIEAAAIKAGKGSPEMAFYKEWTKKLTVQAGEAGKNLKAVDTAWTKNTSEGAVIQAQKNVLKAEEKLKPRVKAKLTKTAKELMDKTGMSADEAMSAAKQKLGIPELTDEDIINIKAWMDKSNATTDPYMQKMYRSKAMQIVADKEPVTFRDKFRSLQRIFMLMNLKTLLTRNVGGNTLFAALENAKDVPGGIIDAITSLATGKRTTQINPFPRIGGQAKGAVKGVAELAKDIKYGADTAASRSAYELPRKTIWRTGKQKTWVSNAANAILNTSDKTVGKVLSAGDRPFYEAGFQGRLAELEKLGYDITATDTIKQAEWFALDRVFQNDSVLAKTAMGVRDKLGIAGDLIQPFVQTPANVFDKMLDYTPAGLGKAIYGLVNPAKGVFNQKLFVDRLARAFTGGGLIALGYVMADKGLIRGRGDQDKDFEAAQRRMGNNQYSIQLGDGVSFTIDFAQPAAAAIIFGADARLSGNGKGDVLEQFVDGTKGAIDSMLNQSFLQGVLKLMSGYSPADSIESFLLGAPTQFTSSLLAQIAQQDDEYMRETYDPNQFIQAGKVVLSRIPFARKLLPVKVDTAGNPMKNFPQETQLGKAAQNFILPGKTGYDQGTAADKEAQRLFKATGSHAAFLRVAPKSITYKTADGSPTTATLSSQEYVDYQAALGKKSTELIDSLLTSSEYAKLSDAEKVKEITNELTLANNYAQFLYLKSKSLIPQGILNGTTPGWAKTLSKMLGISIADAHEFTGH